ncbi:adenosylcobyric acid synthase (glutamine-hydrolysing) [Nocardioides sp. J9]|uniref:cobyric acid synthase n=1 Tax=Nocardioides sp. J9 TaxID=935844 RepID=UPI0011AD344C|nr:cobyric acid synthase [Nocardioides sp. J9]TWH03372.1 adenosylcobyric acid synthase (glutamine-hydrolysing) [Nocardioides sp. J9]
MSTAPRPVGGALLVAGTASDAGKSVLTTGLCRAFARRGIRVAPFKAQNMSNNSMVVRGPGAVPGEVGRAQWVQALAAGVEPEVAMNPVLLKPGSDRRSHVVLMGQPDGEVSAGSWHDGRARLAETAFAAFDDLRARFDLVVAEGAGSPAEINLRATDYVNMGLARHGDVPTIVVGDIDRGGWFAAAYGTLMLLDEADRALVKGYVVNKFRGDVDLLRPGLADLEQRTGRPTYGALPWHPDLWLDSEDSLDLDGRRAADRAGSRKVAVVRLPRISDFTDVDALGLEPALDVELVSDPARLADADLVVVPGTRATIADLAWLRSRGLDLAIQRHAAAGRPVLGICGGCQLLGRRIEDPDGVEGPAGVVVDGLGLLDLTTRFSPEKRLVLHEPAGYEIHHGRVTGETRTGAVTGTMVHGSLEDDTTRAAYLADTLGVTSSASFPAARAARLDLLGDLVEEHLDLDAVLSLC